MTKTVELIEQLGELSSKNKLAYKMYKESKEKEDELREELTLSLQSDKLRSAKTDKYLVTIAQRPTIQIASEQDVLTWIKNNPEYEADMYVGLKATPFKSFAMTYMKKTGEVIDGTDYVINESLMIKENAKDIK